MNTPAFIDLLSRTVRQAVRGFSRTPAFTIAAVVTLGLGIGATTAIFSVVYSVLIKPLSYPDPEELVRIRYSAPGFNLDDIEASSNMYLTYREENTTFAEVGLWQATSATLVLDGEAERVSSLRVTDGTLQALGVQPILGRWFTESEHGQSVDGPTPVILSYSFWQQRFGGDEAVLGRTVSIESPSGNGTLPLAQPSQVVGIMPAGFTFLDAALQPDMILPVRLDLSRQAHGVYYWQMLARLRPGVTLAQARADVERMAPIWLDAWPPFPGTTREQLADMLITPIVRPLKDDLVGAVSSMLWVVMGAIGAVLLIACANVANLMLVRGDARRQELATRAALGAGPGRIAGELLVESLLLSAAGALFGLILAYIGLRYLVVIGPTDLPRLLEVAIHPPVLYFTVIVSLVSTLVFGSITAVKQALHIDSPLHAETRGSSASRETNATRSALVVAQVALALLLVVSAALMIRTFQSLRDVDPGFSDPATIQTAKIWVPANVFPDAAEVTRIEREILDGLEALPGVTSVGFVNSVPLESAGMGIVMAVEGQPFASEETPRTNVKFASPGYFSAMGTRIIAGRDMTWGDIDAGGRVVVISKEFARALGPAPIDALGKRVRFAAFSDNPWREVIGVVQNIYEDGVYESPPGMVYFPALTENLFDQPSAPTPTPTLVIRSDRAGTAGLTEEIRRVVRSVSRSIPVAQMRTMQELYADSFARTAFTLLLLAIAGAMALVLGIVGIYGVIAYVVSQRTREIGIRSALGAEPQTLTRMFLRYGLTMGAAGAAIGSPGQLR